MRVLVVGDGWGSTRSNSRRRHEHVTALRDPGGNSRGAWDGKRRSLRAKTGCPNTLHVSSSSRSTAALDPKEFFLTVEAGTSALSAALATTT